MIFIKDTKIYATVWNVERKEKYTDLRISTSEKDMEGKYINSNWFARMIGHSHQKLKDLKREDRIVITTAKLTNEPYTDKDGNKKSSFKFLILEAETANQSGSHEKPESKPKDENTGEPVAEGELPW